MGGNSARQWLFSANFSKRTNRRAADANRSRGVYLGRRADPAAFGLAREGELAKGTLHPNGGALTRS
jgi:hypothetical protein